MLKIIFLVIILILVGIVIFSMYVRETNPVNAYQTKTLRVGKAELEVFVADTSEKRTQGLMNVSELAANTGMIFMFPESAPRTFWNKNTLVPLDLIWVRQGQVVGVSSLPSITQSDNQIVSIPSPEAIDWVLEANAGWASAHDVKVGDQVKQ